MSLRADARRTLAVMTLSLVTGLVGVVTVWSLKVIVDAAARGDESSAVTAALAIAAVTGLGMVAGASVTRMMFPLKERTALLLDQRMVDLAGGTATIEHHERPTYLARIDVLRREGHVLASVGFNVADCLEVVVEAVATGLLLARVDPVLLAIPVFAIPSLWAGARAERVRQQALDDTAADAGRARHLFELATSAAPGKELRVYGLADELLSRHREATAVADRALDRAGRTGVLWMALGWLVFTLGYGAAIVVVVRGAIEGTATVGEVVLALTMVARVNTQVAGAVGSFSVLARTVRVAGRYLWLEEYAARRRGAHGEEAGAAVPDRVVEGIELREVSFRYPEGGADALDSVSLLLPAGSTVALVGDNGAGKSTLVKLLCRLYEPVAGTVLVDGTDLTRFDVDEWRARTSAGFQDFARLELLARETVGVGHLPSIEDAEAVSAALRRADATGVVSSLEDGLETPLGASFDDGTELSGGQWQKLALARALMRVQPLLLVLDEPTAALDAEAEHALFSRYGSEARSVLAGHDAIVVLVSHRFSTVNMADTIVVLEKGRVVETGSHHDLVAARGLYAELYELQARSYR
jgi:ATP-binding cassette subfamily B protein